MDWLETATAQGETRFLTPNDATAEGQPSDLFQCEGAQIYVMAASEPSQSSEESIQRNTPSIVLMVESHLGPEPFRAMLTGDATRETEAAILARYSPGFLDVDVLKVGHHGSETSTFDPGNPNHTWLSATSPAYAVTTAGHRGGYFLPRCSVMHGVLSADSLAQVGCHELECGQPAEGLWRADLRQPARTETPTGASSRPRRPC